MERLAREKIALQQRLSTLKKDMLGKWDHLDWRSMVPEELDMDIESDPVIKAEYGSGRKSLRKLSSPDVSQPPKIEHDSEHDESDDSQHPLSRSLNNCHNGKSQEIFYRDKKSFFSELGVFNNFLFEFLGDQGMDTKIFSQMNGMNGMSGPGPISLVTATKLSSSPLAAITVEKTANSPVG